MDRTVSVSSSQQATVKSWSVPYQGNIPKVLYEYMRTNNNPWYEHILAIVQSSGTGKSRLIDEFSKSHFVIPLNLRASESGFPAADYHVRYWFEESPSTPDESHIRSRAFLTALLEKTLEIIKDPQAQIHDTISELPTLTEVEKADALQDYPDTLPGQFRLFMTIGQKFSKQGELRIDFYDRVLRRAKDLLSRAVPNPIEQQKLDGQFRSAGSIVELEAVATKVLQQINPLNLRNAVANDYPTLFLAFDSPHILEEVISTGHIQWSKFSTLRRALWALRWLPIWSIFLSTMGKFQQFVPASFADSLNPSSCILESRLATLTPFTALGFDLLAEKVSFDGSYKLDDVASLKHRISLGRPLWLSRYEEDNSDIQRTLIFFAIEKLVCCAYHPEENMATSTEQQFDVLSHRLPLDFDTPACSGSTRRYAEKNQMVQVKKHMGICLGFKEECESLVTVAASEPILVQAAATVMQHIDFSSCRALLRILEWPGVSKGDIGKLIVANITIDTLDGLSFLYGKLESPVVKATSYFEALFVQNLYKDRIQDAMPSRLRVDSDNNTFGETFKDAHIYVTHFIKVYDSVLTDGFIMGHAARGAGIVCVDNQAGVDLILPVLYKDRRLKRTNITVIMKQARNDTKVSTTPKRYHFSAMNPFTLGIFNKQEQNPRPIIRMMYALAARESIVHVMERGRPSVSQIATSKDQPTNYSYTSFDIWCGQTSSLAFGTIRPEDNGIYQELLTRSKNVVEMFDLEQASMKELTMSMHPGATSEPAHWMSFIDISSVANAAPSDGEGLSGASGESGRDDESGGFSNKSLKPAPAGPSSGTSSISSKRVTAGPSSGARATHSAKSTPMSDKREGKKRKIGD